MSGAVVIAGGLGAIGKAITARLGADGQRVITLGRRHYNSPDVARDRSDCGFPEYVRCDLRDPAEAEVIGSFGELRAAIYCAGLSHPGSVFATTDEQIAAMASVNLLGAANFARVAARAMVERDKGGALLYIGSWAARVPDLSDVYYGATKAGGSALFRNLALALAPHRIRSLTLEVGVVEDDGMAVRHMSDAAYTERVSSFPLPGRLTTADAAAAAVWLIGDDARCITGETLRIDRGASLRQDATRHGDPIDPSSAPWWDRLPPRRPV